ncbi:GNAT family N-acetyltransferase [Nocardioides marmoriginsengisoli]|uniref:GNAT family N-acetyltransferase n=1 Tax=Nocardioides marmoriginsengisoli TaxID=661483 RepID=A0A3N0CBC1_9ACTN|nr:GNAT family N-acetyltransferase [Nocardioides marmoriginsengisoli]RNL60742.1 GNAT family N-acetyltransferase [Nocardioides marmoriginsengisoli]
MARKVDRLTLDNLGSLPGHGATCTFWELEPVRRGRIRGHEAEEKAAWLSGMLRDWGSVGRVVSVDGVPAGHVIWAPALHLPGGDGFATAPVSTDAVLLGELYVDDEFRGQGLGRVLIQSMAKDLIKHGGIGAVETFGAHRPRADVCVLPVDFLLAVGFKTHRGHPRYPRMRMDLRSTITWREEFEVAAGRLLEVVKRPARQPAPHPSPRGVPFREAGGSATRGLLSAEGPRPGATPGPVGAR